LNYQVQNKKIIQDLSVSIEGPGITTILGENGAGKSSLLRCLSGLWEKSKNQILLQNQPLAKIPLETRSRILAWCPAESTISFSYSILDICLMGFYPWKQQLKEEDQLNKIDSLLKLFNLDQKKNQNYQTLSSGEKKLVNLTRVLATPHKIVILDEPTAHLDLRNTFKVFNLLHKESRQGKNIILATHDIQQAYQAYDRMILLQKGKIFSDTTRKGKDILPLMNEIFGVYMTVSGNSLEIRGPQI